MLLLVHDDGLSSESVRDSETGREERSRLDIVSAPPRSTPATLDAARAGCCSIGSPVARTTSRQPRRCKP